MTQESNVSASIRPSRGLAWSVCATTVILWGVVRLVIFRDTVMPLTYVLPLLICVWTRDKRMLWGMAGIFTLFNTIKVWWVLPEPALSPFLDWVVYLSHLVNIFVAGIIIHVIINLRDRLERKNAALAASNAQLAEANEEITRQNETLQKTNAVLEATNEDLAAREEEISRQNEELQSQSEELAQQNEEMKAQGEELEQQNEELQSQSEELQTVNEELAQREELLQTLLTASGSQAGEVEVLGNLCRQGLRLLGGDVIAAAVMEAREDMLHVHSHMGVKTDGSALVRWPLKQSLARLVMQEDRAAALEDMSLRPDLIFPQPEDGVAFRSILATPVRVGQKVIGAIEFYTAKPRQWTGDQFRLAEWVASRCSSVLEAMRLRQALQESEARLRAVLDQLPSGVTIREMPSGQMLIFNEQAARVLGRPVSALADIQQYEAIHADGRPYHEEEYPLIRAANLGETVHGEELSLRRTDDGRRMTLSVSAAPVRAPDGRIIAAVAVFDDITNRKQAEDALRQSEQRLNRSQEIAHLGSWELDLVQNRLTWSDEVYRIFGLRPQESVATYEAFLERIHPEDRAAVDNAYSSSVREGKSTYEIEHRVVRQPGGEVRWVHERCFHVRDAAGRIIRSIGMVLDITDRKRLEQSQREAMAAAEEASRAKDQFLAVLSHELRTPLTPVLLTASLLANRRDLPADVQEDIDTIQRNVQLETRLIDDLLDLTRIARGKVKFEFQSVDAHLLMRSAADICGRGEGARIELELKADQHWVRADSSRLQQVFWNLLSNARKFTPPDGAIRVVSCNSEGGRLRVEVRDTGCGIEPAFLPRVFDAFEQGGNGNRPNGLGLGMAISKAIMEAHGGSIVVHSDGKDKGAVFTVELALAAPPACGTRTESRNGELAAAAGPALRILLVEDHESTRAVLCKLVLALGHQVEAASDVASAKKAAERGKFDLIISDLGLPDGTGHELMRWLKQEYGLTGVAISGYGMEDDIRTSLDCGFVEHLTKPVSFPQLEAVLRRIVAGNGRNS